MEGPLLMNRTPLVKAIALATTAMTLSACSSVSMLTASPTPEVTAEREIATTNVETHEISTDPVEHTDAVVPPNDIWEVIRNGLSLDTESERRAVAQQIQFYSQHQSYLNRVSTRATPFMHHIVSELQARDMPLELALLPIVESAFDPFAYSHGRASGLWQFIPSTGEYFGLEQQWWYDGRRDPVAATDAALTYLQQLANRFDGDWELAIAAYNGGGGRVNNARTRNLRQNKATDFWSLDLPRETEGYVPKLLALAEIVSNPEKYGVTLPVIPNEPYFTTVDPGYQIDILTAARLADLSESEFRALNAGYTKWATAPDTHQRVNVPIDRAESFLEGISSLPEGERIRFERYQVQSGDVLGTIAQRFNTRVDAIQAYNDLSNHSIRSGDYLLIPIPAGSLSEYASSDWQRLARAQQRGGQSGALRVDVTVASGDSLWKLARDHSVTVSDIARWNNMAPGDPIRPGQNLVVWQRTETAEQTRRVNYSVRQGDSLARIAQRFKVTINDLRRWNSELRSARYIQPGQSLTIFVNINNQS